VRGISENPAVVCGPPSRLCAAVRTLGDDPLGPIEGALEAEGEVAVPITCRRIEMPAASARWSTGNRWASASAASMAPWSGGSVASPPVDDLGGEPRIAEDVVVHLQDERAFSSLPGVI
jgi:hypothetical protein